MPMGKKYLFIITKLLNYSIHKVIFNNVAKSVLQKCSITKLELEIKIKTAKIGKLKHR